jgi:hypothetical protein
MQVTVQLFAADAGLDAAVAIVGVYCEDVIHAAQIKTEAAMSGDDATLDAGTSAKGDDGEPVPVTDGKNA